MASVTMTSSINLESIFSKRFQARSTSNSNKTQSSTATRVPSTAMDWKRALLDIKGEYLGRRYRSCATRCHDLLSGEKTSKSVEPAHLVYLHFYAASALEMQARSLHGSSTNLRDLLDRARHHYRRASILAESEAGAATRIVSSRSVSPAASHSPSLSVGSSVASLGPDILPPTPAPRVKHVTFQCGPPEIIDDDAPRVQKKKHNPQHDPQPMIRPDSPTLGFEDNFAPWARADDADVPALDLTLGQHLDDDMAPDTADESDDSADVPPLHDPFRLTRSLRRYSSVLSALHRQITLVHLPAVERAPAPSPAAPSNDGTTRPADLRARIERLKARGWARKRFDAAKYEALREAAMADLME